MLMTGICWIQPSFGQVDSAGSNLHHLYQQLDTRSLGAIQGGFSRIENKLVAYSERAIAKIKGQESRLLDKLKAKDSFNTKLLFGDQTKQYDRLLQQLKGAGSVLDKGKMNAQEYIPGLDSLQTSFAFLEKSGLGLPGVSLEQLASIKAASGQLKKLQADFAAAANIKAFLKTREASLQAELQKFGLSKELKQFNKQAFYYQQQISGIKEMVNDQAKAEKKLLGLLREQPTFKDFMAKNSQLAQLFQLPGSSNEEPGLPDGLQTRLGLEQSLAGKSAASVNPQAMIQGEVQKAQAELTKLKDKVNQLGGSGSSDLILPSFTPNQQKTKSFWKRLEYGLNIQSVKSSRLLPATSDLALTVGYKLSDKSVVGIGAGYKLGWGKGIRDMRLSSEGVSLRSFVDLRLKGSFWITGGYEMNYLQGFTRIDQLKDQTAWQQSGLLGITKKYRLGKKRGNLQLLWDFLSYSQVPVGVPLKFRVGYVF